MNARPNPKVLIADDQPINVKILQRKLSRENVEVFLARDGVECIEKAQLEKPDLILLDIMMPRMDGLEACRKLMSHPSTSDIPIIFITAKGAREDKLTGLDIGGIDYITKPIDLDETMARIRTQLRLRQMHQENVELQARLGEARKTAAIGSITQGMAHTLNNLLGVVVGYLDLLKIHKDKPERFERSFGAIERAVHRMTHIVGQVSNVANQETLAATTRPISDVLAHAIDRFREEQGVSELRLDPEFDGIGEERLFSTNSETFEHVFSRLLMNAWESYSDDTPTEQKVIRLRVSAGTFPLSGKPSLNIEIIDHGCGVPVRLADHIFEPFVTSKTAVGRGLGLTIAKHGAANLRGEVQIVPNDPPPGTTARFVLPLDPEA